MLERQETGETGRDRTAELLSRVLLDREQRAEVLGVEPVTVSYLHRIGVLRGVRVGRRLHWRPADIRQYVESLEIEG